jgi:uncharacterized membrane protein
MINRPLINTFNRVLLSILIVVTALGFVLVPLDTSLPIHWNIEGRADRFAPAPLALLLPALMAAVVLGLYLVLGRGRWRRQFDAGRHVIDVTTSFILALAILLCAITIAIGLGTAVDVPRLIVLAMGVMLLVVGNYLPKTQPNFVAGIRLPWTLRDARNWQVTHRWTGRLMMLGGVLVLLAGLVVSTPAMLFAVLMAAIIGPVLAAIIISYSMARTGPGIKP